MTELLRNYQKSKPTIRRQDLSSLGWRDAHQQDGIYQQKIAVAGVGGAGGACLELLAREGVSSFSIADPDVFDTTNLNRQAGSSLTTLGKSKAVVMSEFVESIHGDRADVSVFEDGVTVDNMNAFLDGATIAIDAIDVGNPTMSLELARAARRKKLPVFMAVEVGRGCFVSCFDPEGATMEQYFGVDPGTTVAADLKVATADILAHVPSYTPVGLLEAFTAGDLPATPATASGVALLSSLMTICIERWILGDTDSPSYIYPNFLVMDAIDGLIEVADQKTHLADCLAKLGSRQLGGMASADHFDVVD